MKTSQPILLLAAACAALFAGCSSGASTSAAPSHTLIAGTPLDADLPFQGGLPSPAPIFERAFALRVVGLDPHEVMQLLGTPAQRLTPDVWIYWKYYTAEQAAAENGGHDTLVVAFVGGKVSAMKLVRTEDLRRGLAHGQFAGTRQPL